MAALMRLTVTPATGEPYQITVTPAVIVAAERHFGKGMNQLFGEQMSYEALAWLAWKATHRSGAVVKPFDEWLDGIEGIEAGDETAIPLEIQ